MGDKDVKKILLVSPAAAYGGAEVYLLKFAEYLAFKKQWSVSLAINTSIVSKENLRLLEQKGCSVKHCDIEWFWEACDALRDGDYKNKVKRQFTALQVLIEEIKPDCTFVNMNWASFGLGLFLALEQKSQSWCALFHLVPHRLDVSPLEKHFYASLAPQKCFFGVSKNTALFAEKSLGLAKETVDVIANSPPSAEGLPKLLRSKAKNAKAVRKEFGISPDSPIILFAGRLDVQKGICDNFLGLVRLFEIKPNAVALIAGDGPHSAMLADLIADFGLERKVLLLGYRKDVLNLIAGSDVFFLPSRYEGRCLALLEALALGTTVVTTDIEPNKEIIEDNENGYLARQGDWRHIALRIHHAISNPLRADKINSSMKSGGNMYQLMEEKLLNVLGKCENSALVRFKQQEIMSAYGLVGSTLDD